jgi:hypothetical protein
MAKYRNKKKMEQRGKNKSTNNVAGSHNTRDLLCVLNLLMKRSKEIVVYLYYFSAHKVRIFLSFRENMEASCKECGEYIALASGIFYRSWWFSVNLSRNMTKNTS